MQISEWEAYDRIDPIGTWRSDFSIASLESLLVNIVNSLYHKEGETPEVVSAIDFMPIWDSEARKSAAVKPKQSVGNMKDLLMYVANVQNKNAKRKETIDNKRKNKLPPPVKKARS